MPFKPGQSGNPRGKSNPGRAGRAPNWLKAKCRELVGNNKLISFLADVARGKDVVTRLSLDGDELHIPADIKDRLRALEMLLDRGYGKPQQEVVKTEFVFEFVGQLSEILNRVIPDQCPHCKNLLNLRNQTAQELESLSKKLDLDTV